MIPGREIVTGFTPNEGNIRKPSRRVNELHNFLSHRTPNSPPLVAHLIYRLGIGGLENGLVNLINHMPAERYRHAIICLAGYTEFRQRLRRSDVPVISLNKRAGTDLGAYGRLWRLLRRMRPDILHSRSWAGLDGQICAVLAGVPGRIHGEHGFNTHHVESMKHRIFRRAMSVVINRHTTVSGCLTEWLGTTAGIQGKQITTIYNGVDTDVFRPEPRNPYSLTRGKGSNGEVVIGTVGRMEPIKGHLTLIKAFIHLSRSLPNQKRGLRLVIVGDGSQRSEAMQLLASAGLADASWLPGASDEIPDILRTLDVFVLPSLSEGMSNTILEAMATGLPVIATRVGGNSELVREGRTGTLVEPKDVAGLGTAIEGYIKDPDKRASHGMEARRIAESRFSLEAMVNSYAELYDSVLRKTR